ncbi:MULTISPECIES: LysE family translocator [Phyllobacteriaceae]|jgi:threonine/homoserine/homoserine lactone efflux protein|uniref:Threonine transporter n=1 Tax=Mesorhizobium hungaricum TaxID=1566387 RepID=A0A1C2DIV3_9HYPH|nr:MULTISPECIES: LysE family translocator [Mesorhizobium]MBN9234311.1 LysE family translocator [Mesorhizobium sp.]MDQ0332377.1 threonine/homoserine/homoserine lactone efflux protein [Mesorhizobium sp. YL-MeA3-2017]OCX14586.1 threonine transporter [Mesorhizobium hungaricum]
MSPLAALLAIVTAVLIGAISPGPSFLFVTRISIAQSRMHGLATAIGMGAGGTVFASLALLGLAALLNQVAWLYLALKLAGGCYLVWLGLRIWRGAAEPLPSIGTVPVENRSLWRSVLFATLTQLSNPKTAVVYASIFAAMLPAAPPAWLLLLLPPLVFVVEAGWYAVVALVFSADYPRAAYSRGKLWVDRLAGTAMGLLGLRLIIDGIGLRKL